MIIVEERIPAKTFAIHCSPLTIGGIHREADAPKTPHAQIFTINS